jgi:dihydrolipoamide dehydrogenase
MEEKIFDLIVIGGGPAGVTAALRASELGAGVLLIERDRLGGTCTNDGCVPTRVLAHAARLLREAEQFKDYGLVADIPTLDFSRLLDRTQQVVYQIHEKKQLLQHLMDAGVSVVEGSGRAYFVDPHTVSLEDGSQFNAEKFILCAGGHARRLDFPGAEYTINHSDIWTLKKLPRSLVIAGAAATGCQVASILNAFGVQVTLVERFPRILAVEDEAVSELIQQSFEEKGIKIITNISAIESIEKIGNDLEVHYSRNNEPAILQAEAVMLSAGWLGNLDFLNLTAANVETQGAYIKVDEHLCTTAPHIYAAGDITGRMMLVQSAGFEAQVATENALLGPGRRNEHSIVPHGGFTDPEYASVGLTEAKARSQQDCSVTVVPYSDIDRAVIDNRPVGLCKMIVSRETHRILGVHVVGEQALEVVEVAAAAMAADMWVEQLAELEMAYPTFTAILGLAARNIVFDLGVIPMAQAWQQLGKPRVSEWEQRLDGRTETRRD